MWNKLNIITTCSWEIGKPNATDVIAEFNWADSTFTITGSGATKDFATSSPWSYIRDNIKKAVVGSGITHIGYRLFGSHNNLADVTIEKDIISIENSAFEYCKALRNIRISAITPPELHASAFGWNGNLNLSEINVYVPCASTPAYLADTIWNKLNIIIGDCIWEIGTPNAADVTATFNHADSTLTITGSGSMQDFALVSATPWYNILNNIKRLVVHDGITNIGSRVFGSSQSKLTDLTIGKDVTSIGAVAFASCEDLRNITITAVVPPAFVSTSFFGIDRWAINVYVPCTSVQAYLTNPNWIDFNILGRIDSVFIYDSFAPGSTYTEHGFNVSEAGTHYLELQSADGCDSIVVLVLSYTMGVGTDDFDGVIVGASASLRVSPNPTSGVITVEGCGDGFCGLGSGSSVSRSGSAACEISVYSSDGRLVLRSRSNRIDLSACPSGVYILRAGNKTARVVKK
jgi:hypothetical protein